MISLWAYLVREWHLTLSEIIIADVCEEFHGEKPYSATLASSDFKKWADAQLSTSISPQITAAVYCNKRTLFVTSDSSWELKMPKKPSHTVTKDGVLHPKTRCIIRCATCGAYSKMHSSYKGGYRTDYAVCKRCGAKHFIGGIYPLNSSRVEYHFSDKYDYLEHDYYFHFLYGIKRRDEQ